MEASALQAPAALARTRISIGAPLLRLRSDEQLVALFRAGNDEAFRVIHDRYRQRLFAYARQMLAGSRQDAEDALQDIFVRAYAGLRANDRELSLRAWLYRVAHNRCIDELRRPVPPAPEVFGLVASPIRDPIEEAERRESLRRLIADVRRLPEQQRSALLMRELGGMSYADLAAALGATVPAVKSLLVRARVGLAHAAEARDVACAEIRTEMTGAHDRGVRPSGLTRRHLRDCHGCRDFRRDMRGTTRDFAALAPGLGPLGLICHALGIGGGGAASGGGAAAAAGGAAGTGGAVASAGVLAAGAGHVATLLAAAVVTAGGAVEIQSSFAPAAHQRPVRHAVAPSTAYPGASPSPAAPAVAPVIADPAAVDPAPPVKPAATIRSTSRPTLPATASPAATAPGRSVNSLDHSANGPNGTTGPNAGTPAPGSSGGTDSTGTTSTGTTTGDTGTGSSSSTGATTMGTNSGSTGTSGATGTSTGTQFGTGSTGTTSAPATPGAVPASTGSACATPGTGQVGGNPGAGC